MAKETFWAVFNTSYNEFVDSERFSTKKEAEKSIADYLRPDGSTDEVVVECTWENPTKNS